MTYLGCIADDLTGATDLAALLARSGAQVALRIGVPAEPPHRAADLEVIALKCRTSDAADAVRECRAALAWLRAAGASRFFWKYCSTFDSTAKGNIGPVAEALMADLGSDQTIYCPAFPENGRTVFMGNLFVGRQLLAESPMRDHPLTPMRDSNLMRLLAPQVERPVGLVDRMTVAKGASSLVGELQTLQTRGIAHVIVDAVSNEDLAVIAEACRDMKLITGGSAVAMPLPGLYLREGLFVRTATSLQHGDLPPGAIVLSGSCSAMTRAQVAHYASIAPNFRLDPLLLAREGTGAAHAWFSRQPPDSNPLIYATAEPADVRRAQEALGVARAGEIVEEALAELAVLARERGVRRFVVAGGETSGAVAKALGADHLDVGREIAPGVPWTFCESSGQRIALTLKSGNFGSETFFADALRALELG